MTAVKENKGIHFIEMRAIFLLLMVFFHNNCTGDSQKPLRKAPTSCYENSKAATQYFFCSVKAL